MLAGCGSALALSGMRTSGAWNRRSMGDINTPPGPPQVNCPPGFNCQIQPTQNTGNPMQTECNTAGGYSMQKPSCYTFAQCMTAGDFAAAQQQCNAAAIPSGGAPPPTAVGPTPVTPPITSYQATGSPVTSPYSGSTPAPAPSTGSGDLMLGSVDISQFWSNYGFYLLLAGGGLIVWSLVK